MMGQKVLNFGKADVKGLRNILSAMEELPVTADSMEMRAKTPGAAVTLYKSGKIVVQGINPEIVAERILREMGKKPEILLGIDETGRGELTGPMVVAAVLGDSNKLRELRDSKKTSKINEKEKIVTKNSLSQVVVALNAEMIDILRSNGKTLNEIEAVIVDKISEMFSGLELDVKVKVDGSALATKNKKIEFIVKGDDAEPVIGAASVLAKNYRNNSFDSKERKTWRNSGKNNEK